MTDYAPIITQAIGERRLLAVTYKGKDRIVEPYCYGLASTGNYLLRCYQTDGDTVSGNRAGWKLLNVAALDGVSLTSATFEPIRDGYNPADKALVDVLVCIPKR
jgi:hypothetical protein